MTAGRDAGRGGKGCPSTGLPTTTTDGAYPVYDSDTGTYVAMVPVVDAYGTIVTDARGAIVYQVAS